MKKLFPLIICLITTACITTGCEESATGTNDPTPPVPLSALRQFKDCNEIVAFFGEAASNSSDTVFADDVNSSGGSGDGADLGAPEAASDEGSSSARVEQADIVKHVGNRLYILSHQLGLLIYDVSAPASTSLLSRTELNLTPVELFVDGLRVAIVGNPNYYGPIATNALSEVPGATQVRVYDVTDAKKPDLLESYALTGSYSDSRKVDNTIYLVTRQWVYTGDIEEFSDDKDECQRSYAPESILDEPYFYSVTAWQVDKLDLAQLGELPKPITVFGGDWSQFTASPDYLYLSNYSYNGDETEIFAFHIANPQHGVIPRANGSVPGQFVNQFSMDEYKGHFRIATTTNRSTFGADDNRNYLTLFDVNNGFKQVGQTDAIAPGESITAARLIQDTAYVTTFVTKDPLITIDLSDPANPTILGELDVPGFPTHIHVWGDLLISIGSEQEFWGRVILSLFDISSLSQPTLIEQITIEESDSSEAQREHRAFSFFEDRGVLSIPIQYQWSKSYMAVYKVGPSGFTSLAQVTHDDLITEDTEFSPRMRRSLDIGNALYTISEAGLKANSFDDLSDELFGELFPGFEVPNYGCYWEYCGPIAID